MRNQGKTRSMKKKKMGVGIYLVGVIVAVSLFWMARQSVSGSSTVTEDQKAYFHQLESEFRENIRMELDQMGYSNSGITMSSIIELDGSRIYTIVLHHKRISQLSIEQQEELITELAQNEFPETQCQVIYKVLP